MARPGIGTGSLSTTVIAPLVQGIVRSNHIRIVRSKDIIHHMSRIIKTMMEIKEKAPAPWAGAQAMGVEAFSFFTGFPELNLGE